MNTRVIRFICGRGSARFILPILLLWLSARTEVAFGQLVFPDATTMEATDVTSTSATLNGVVNPNNLLDLLSTKVEFEYGTTDNYGITVPATPNYVTGIGQHPVSAQITDLLPNKTYHFRVVATNILGSLLRTGYGEDKTFTTYGRPTVTTNDATDVTASSATLNGAVNPGGVLSTTVEFEYGTTTGYGTTVTATPSPVTGLNPVPVSAMIARLSPNTIYHYRVVASNLLGTDTGADKTFTTGAEPTAITDNAAEVCSTSATLHGTVNPNGPNTTIMFEYGASTSYGDSVPARPSPVNGTDQVSVSATMTNLFPGRMYHYRVVATNDGGTSRGNDHAFTTYSSTFSLSNTVNFSRYASAADYKATDYRLVGLPGASDLAVNELFAGQQHNEDWEVVWDNGKASNFFVRFNGEEDFKFSLGRAFWVIHKGPWEINTTVPSEPLVSCQFVSIPLDSGWNLITNPFTTSIQWPEIQSANGGILQPLYSYNASFDTSSWLDPYVGYYFFNETNLSALRIPHVSSSAASVISDVDPAIWRVNVTLTSGEFVDKITSFGVANKASAEFDLLDFHKPRAIAATPTVSFHRPTWDARYSAFATDFRPEIAESESWGFEVRTPAREAARLTFSGITKIPTPFEIYLIDEGRAGTINLREDSLYFFTPETEISKFSVVVGRKDAVQEKLSAVALPKEFVLSHNYPNPFNPETTIPVAVPIPSETRLVIYNTLGKEVKTIYSGMLPAGRYWFNWEGKDEAGKPVATGVYLYRLTTSTSVALMGKMLVIK